MHPLLYCKYLLRIQLIVGYDSFYFLKKENMVNISEYINLNNRTTNLTNLLCFNFTDVKYNLFWKYFFFL